VAEAGPLAAIEKSCPVPLSDTVCGLFVALSVNVRLPVLVPLTVGSKKTPMVQFVPGATLLPQALSAPKSAGDAVTLVIVTVEVPALLSVTVCGRPDVPTYWLGKVIEGGDKLTPEVGALPIKPTLCGLPGPLSLTLSDPVRTPHAVGVKVTLIRQLALLAREVPQVLV